jgi:spermidine synthase
MGPSGSGKSTLLGMIAGTVNPHRGWIKFDGETLFDTRKGVRVPASRRRVGLVHEHPPPHRGVEGPERRRERKEVVLGEGDVAEAIRNPPAPWDGILLDVDNGPQPITDVRNRDIYGPAGIQSCVTALRAGGSLAVWSSFFDPRFEQRLRQARLHVRSFRVPAYLGSSSYHCCIWLASRDRNTVVSRI